MPKPFHKLTLEQFAELLGAEGFPFKRKIDSVHLHHTWRPQRAQYKGVETINGMWRYHTEAKGWSDIAQHITIAPDGSIWTGRSWNQPPASAAGYNGNGNTGPFMLEIIGDFDKGGDSFDGEQKRTALEVIAHVQRRFGLQPETLRFHNMISDKSCPGSSLDYQAIVREVSAVAKKIAGQRAALGKDANFPFEDRARAIWAIIDTLKTPATTSGGDEGEGCERDVGQNAEFERATVAPPQTSRGLRGNPLPPELIQRLRPHVINLNQGQLSATGEFQSREGDVDAIFEEHLHQWAANERAGKKIPIVFYAHGGLTSEQAGLLTADEQVKWWLENGAYPIHFVWETGLIETLEQLLNPRRRRGIDFAGPTDFALETLARGIGGPKIWAGMKLSAERASDESGGARYVAQKLKEFCDEAEFKDRVELHAVGHSAGAIFLAHFLPLAIEIGTPFNTAHFLAPAIRVDTFENTLLDKDGLNEKIVKHLSLFTMAREFELDDNCFTIYRKSLLYLIYYALEPDRATPILGLEESIRENAKLKRLFNLDRQGSGRGEVIWSVSKDRTEDSATTSRTHGGFNNDAPTMQSVAHRILGHRPEIPFTGIAERGLSFLERLQAQEPAVVELLRPGQPTFAASPTQAPGGPAIVAAAGSGAGRKRALCVGVDRYSSSPLGGCVADAREWRGALMQLGFEDPKLLFDEEATRTAILGTLSEMLRSSRAGDVIVFQFSGHGTQVPDLNSDEKNGDTPDRDEALCPIDCDSGRLIIDDDLASLFDQIPAGVNVTVFADCCHSGSNTRLGVGPPTSTTGRDVRKRFLLATQAMKDAHAAFRKSLGARAAQSRGAYDEAREVLFAACRSREVALESDGHGHFTTQATRLLAAGIEGLTNVEFQRRVAQAFGENSGQNPELHCAMALQTSWLLSPIGLEQRTASSATIASPGAEQAWRNQTARHLESAAQALRG